MGKIAFVFAGQGAQAPGMGKSLYENSVAARGVFETAEGIRPGTMRQCFEGSNEELRETKNTQPCLFVTEMAAAAALTEAGVHADMTAGFSLGELSAITYANALDLSDGLRLVMCRASLMQQAAERQATSMAAVVCLNNDEVQAIAAKFPNVYPVNFNCPGQVSVAGAADEMAAFYPAVKAAGGKAIPLKVNAAFHSPFMASAAEQFGRELSDMAFTKPQIPVYANRTGEVYTEDMGELLTSQIDHPVYWEKIVRSMIAAGADTFFELGPGKTLCGLIKKIDPAVRTVNIAEYPDLRFALQEAEAC